MRGQAKPHDYPIRIFTAAMVLTLVLALGIGWYAWDSFGEFERDEQRLIRLQEARSDIRYLDEAMTMSVMMAVMTADPAWERRYYGLLPRLEEATAVAHELAPEIVDEEDLDRCAEARQTIRKLDEEALALVSQGQPQAAEALLDSSEYGDSKRTYDEGQEEISRAIQAFSEEEIHDQHVRSNVNIAVMGGVMVLLLFAWIFVVRSVRNHLRERDRAEEKLRLLSEAVESSQDGVQIVGLDGRIIYSNRAVENIYGYTPEEYHGMHVGSMNADPGFAQAVILPAIEKTGGWSGEVLVRHKDGHVFPIWLTTSLVGGAEGEPTAMVGGIRDVTELREAEQALRESEERYRLLFENMYEIAWSVDIPPGGSLFENPVSFVNERVRDVTGYSVADFTGRPDFWLSVIHPDDRQAVMDSTEVIAQSKQPRVRIYRIRHKETGEYVWLEENVVPRLDSDGRVASLFGVARDITERKRSEEMLMDIVEGISGDTGLPFFQSLTTRLRKALGAGIAFVGELNREQDSITTIAVDAHGEQADNFEYSLKGTPCENVVGRSPCIYTSGVQQEFPADEDLVKLGVEAYIGMPLFDSAGKPLGIIVVLYHEPISDTATAESLLKIFASRAASELERLGVEQALMRSEEKYRTLFEESKDAVFMASVDGRFVDMNAAGLELLGYDTLDEVRRLDPASGAFAGSDLERYLRDLAEAGFVKDYELHLRRRDGEVRTFAITATLVRDEDGNVTGSWGIGRDMTRHRQLEEQLVQAQKMESIGRLAGGVAHDFNNYLTAVQGYIEMAITDLPQGSPVRPELVEAARSADRAVEVTRQLLLFSRHGQMDLKAIGLNAVIEGLLSMLGRLIGEQFSIATDLDPGLSPVRADPGYMEQVLLNLVVNARDAMPGGGEILVGTQNYTAAEPVTDFAGEEHFGQFVCLWVQDSGEGMDAATRARAFEPFFSTKSVGTGTGLGLSVVYGIVEQHGGWVEVESEPGLGSTFRVYLPIAAGEPEAGPLAGTAGKTDSGLAGRGEKILLVEDEEVVRNLAVRMLSENGYQVAAAGDADAARRLFAEEAGGFLVLFSDVVLPDISGVRLAEELRAQQADLGVLLASGYTGDVVDHSDIESRGYSYLQKPYSLQDLLRALAGILRGPGE
ncbi:MAG: PAS domain S-box protein [Gaiellales bacterium]|nr:MAG: PAS domain S-box protein [Gaiellales bacterium]